jgi:hypothetical protein
VEESSEALLLGVFERFEVLATAIKQITQVWTFRELLKKALKPVRPGTPRGYSCFASTAADLPRQINQRNDDGKRTDDLTNCTSRFPIHGKA